MVFISEILQFSDFAEPFQGNFRTICLCFESSGIEFSVEWKAPLMSA